MSCLPLDLTVIQALEQRIPAFEPARAIWLGPITWPLSTGFTERAALGQPPRRPIGPWRRGVVRPRSPGSSPPPGVSPLSTRSKSDTAALPVAQVDVED